MADMVKVKGIPVELGGATFIVPPLSLGALEQLQDGLENFTGDIRDKAQMRIVLDAAHAALKRNYPDMTREEVGELVDLDNYQSVFGAIMDVSGVKRRALEAAGAAPSGEAKPAG